MSNDKIINKIMNDIKKKFGSDSISLAKDMTDFDEGGIKRIPTGSSDLDIKLGGGIPIGRITQLSGHFSSTKTTQALHIIREAQQQGLLCALLDVENTTTNDYLEQLGIDTDELIYVRPESLEECTQIMVELQKGGVKLIVWDSIAVSEPVKVLSSDMDETVQMGVKQKMIGEYLGKFQSLNNGISRRGEIPCTLIAINQLREKIGGYGDLEFEPGGRAIGYYISVNVRFRKGDWLQEGKGNDKEIVGQEVKYKITKNKTYKRMQSGEFDFYYSDSMLSGTRGGFNDNFKSTIMLALQHGLIHQGGAWFVLFKETEREYKCQGLNKVVEYLRENPQLVEEFKETLLELDRNEVK